MSGIQGTLFSNCFSNKSVIAIKYVCTYAGDYDLIPHTLHLQCIFVGCFEGPPFPWYYNDDRYHSLKLNVKSQRPYNLPLEQCACHLEVEKKDIGKLTTGNTS